MLYVTTMQVLNMIFQTLKKRVFSMLMDNSTVSTGQVKLIYTHRCMYIKIGLRDNFLNWEYN